MEKSILLVEDNPDDKEIITNAVKKSGVRNRLIVTTDGLQALDYLFGMGDYSERDVADIPSLVLLDIKIPGVDGLEVLKRVKTDDRMKRIPVVIFTGFRDDAEIGKSYDFGANSYIVKPSQFDQFTRTVISIVDYWLLVNEAGLLKF